MFASCLLHCVNGVLSNQQTHRCWTQCTTSDEL